MACSTIRNELRLEKNHVKEACVRREDKNMNFSSYWQTVRRLFHFTYRNSSHTVALRLGPYGATERSEMTRKNRFHVPEDEKQLPGCRF